MKKLIFFPVILILLFNTTVKPQACSGHTITNGLFHNPYIWSNGCVPNESATISSGMSVILQFPASLSNYLYIDTGSEFYVENQAALTVGAFTNLGNFVPGNGKVAIGNSSDQYFSGHETTFHDLFLYNGDVFFLGPAFIESSLWLNGGSALMMEDGSIDMGPGATITAQMLFDENHCVIPRYGDDYNEGYLGQSITAQLGHVFFPIGTYENSIRSYSPFELSYNAQYISGDSRFTCYATPERHPQNYSTGGSIFRYWTVTAEGMTNYTATISATYLQSDVQWDESQLWGGKWEDGVGWSRLSAADTLNNVFTGTVSSVGDFTAGDYDVMPVELTSFTGLYDGHANLLTWKTATETNNYGFEVERAFNQPEQSKKDWERIGFVEGNNTTATKKEYKFTDNNVTNGTYYYRLRQIDLDGTAAYSKTIEIEAGKIPKGFLLEQNYPNPFNPSTIISFGSSKRIKAKLVIYDQLGRKVETIFNGIIEENEIKRISFDASDYSGGVYFYKLITPEWTASKKMMLLK